jgi:hypothetical protein
VQARGCEGGSGGRGGYPPSHEGKQDSLKHRSHRCASHQHPYDLFKFVIVLTNFLYSAG